MITTNKKWLEPLLVILVMVLTYFTYRNAVYNEFVNFDDYNLILLNPYVRSLQWDNLKAMFSNFYWYNYQPLTLLSFAIEYHFWGFDSYIVHFNNVMFHIINVLLVFIFIRKLSGRFDIAIISALLFAVHPTRVESIAWASERKDVLYTFFFLLSVIHYTLYVRNDFKTKNLVYSFVFFLLSCFTKGMAVSLTLVLFAIDFYFRRKVNKRFFLDKIPYFIVSLIFGIIVTTAAHSEDIKLINEYLDITERFRTASLGFLKYLIMFFYPFNLSSFHPYPNNIETDVPNSYYIFPVIAFLITIAVLFTLRFSRKIVFAYFFMVFTIMFVLQLYVTNNAFIAEHYTYIPYIGLFYLVGEFYVKIKEYFNKSIINFFIILVIIIISGIFAYTSHKRVEVWKNSLTLWNDVVEKYPNAWKSYNGRAYCYVETQEYPKAIADYTKAINIKPDVFRSWYNRGNVYSLMNMYDSAYADYMQSLKINYKNEECFNNLGILLTKTKKYEKAIKAFDASIYLDSNIASTYANKGLALFYLERYDEALYSFNKALKLNPYYSQVYLYKTDLYIDTKQCNEALKSVNQYIALNPNSGEGYLKRAEVYIECVNDTDKACIDIMQSGKYGFKDAMNFLNRFCVNPDYQVAKVLPIKTVKGKVIKYDNGKIMFETVDGVRNGKNVKLLRFYMPNGKLKEEGVIDEKTGKYKGEVRWYYSNGKDSIIGYYDDQTPYGKWKEFYPNGKLSSEYSYKNGKMHGSYKYYYEDGKLWTEREYKDGLLWNVLQLYNNKGEKLDYGTLKDGDGELKIYDENGNFVETIIYRKGKSR